MTDAYDVDVAIVVVDQLVQGLQAEQRLLLVVLVLEQWHNHGPEEHLDDPLMFLGYNSNSKSAIKESNSGSGCAACGVLLTVLGIVV